jgi:hypothetical protein
MSRWPFYVTGTALVAYGTYGLVTAHRSAPVAWARFAALVVVANDGLLAPIVLVAGALLLLAVPGTARAYLQSGLFISGTLTLLALPFVLGFGRTPDNPSALPLDYRAGLLVTLVAVWLGVGGVAAVREFVRWGNRRTPPLPSGHGHRRRCAGAGTDTAAEQRASDP